VFGHAQQQCADIRGNRVSVGVIIGSEPINQFTKGTGRLNVPPDLAANVIEPEIPALFNA
jgi:hypothetical protein